MLPNNNRASESRPEHAAEPVWPSSDVQCRSAATAVLVGRVQIGNMWFGIVACLHSKGRLVPCTPCFPSSHMLCVRHIMLGMRRLPSFLSILHPPLLIRFFFRLEGAVLPMWCMQCVGAVWCQLSGGVLVHRTQTGHLFGPIPHP